MCSRQFAIIDKERQQHLKLSNLFTVAFSVNLLLFLLAVYFIYSISGSFSELESVAVYDPFSVGTPVPTVLDVALHVHVVCCLFSPNITHHQMPLVLTPAPTFLHMHTLHVTLCGLFPLSTICRVCPLSILGHPSVHS